MKKSDRTLSLRKASGLLLIMSYFLLLSPLLIHGQAAPGIIYVNWDATGANDGSSWDDAFIDLQDALASAVAGDEIWVEAGVYKPTSDTTDRTATFQLVEDVALYGGFIGTETLLEDRDPELNVTILSGDIDNDDNQTPIITDISTVTGNTTNSYHVVTGANDATLDGFTITAGSASSVNAPNDCGGGMYNFESSSILNDISFIGNSADVIYGGGNGGGMCNDSSNPTLTQVTFSSNYAQDYGGGMLNTSSDPILTDVNFDMNSSGHYGGAIYNTLSSPTLTDVSVSNNSAEAGGGIFNSVSSPIITNVTFYNNSANNGGGMFNDSSSPLLKFITFDNNHAVNVGGGIYNTVSSATLSNITFINNSASTGGGMWEDVSRITTLTDVVFSENIAVNMGGGLAYSSSKERFFINNVIFSDNNSDGKGGGIYAEGGGATITNVTLTGNSAYDGGAVYLMYGDSIFTNVTINANTAVNNGGGIYDLSSIAVIRNTVLWGNSALGGSQIYNDPEANHSTFYSVIEGGCPSGSTCYETITDDPLLGPLGDYGGFTQTIPLLEGSSAINTADNDVCPETDQRGVFRPQYLYCDIGAFENNTIAPTVVNSIRVDDNPTNLSSVTFIVTFSDSVTGVDVGDFTLTTTDISNASISEVSGSGSEYSVVVNTGTGDGTIRLDVIDDDSIINAELDPLGTVGIGNGDFSRGESYTIDKTYPIVQTSVRKNSNPTKAENVTFTVSFSEPVIGVDITDFSILAPDLSDTSVEDISGSGSTYDVIVNTGSGTGELELIVFDDDSIVDDVGNRLGGEGSGNGNYDDGEVYSVDRTPPTVLSMICANANPSNSNTVYYIVTFSEPVFVDITDFSLIVDGISNVTIANVYPGSRYSDVHTVTINTGVGNGTIQLNLIDDDTIRDFIGHQLGGEGIGNGDFSGEVYTIDRIPPVVVSSVAVDENPTSADEVDFTVTFSEDVTGVNISDFSLTTDGITGASIINIVGENSEYTVTVSTGTGSGTIQLNVQDDDSIKDDALNPLGSEGEGNGSYYDGDTYTIIGTQYIIFMPLINK